MRYMTGSFSLWLFCHWMTNLQHFCIHVFYLLWISFLRHIYLCMRVSLSKEQAPCNSNLTRVYYIANGCIFHVSFTCFIFTILSPKAHWSPRSILFDLDIYLCTRRKTGQYMWLKPRKWHEYDILKQIHVNAWFQGSLHLKINFPVIWNLEVTKVCKMNSKLFLKPSFYL